LKMAVMSIKEGHSFERLLGMRCQDWSLECLP
jgi:hypothetical protein